MAVRYRRRPRPRAWHLWMKRVVRLDLSRLGEEGEFDRCTERSSLLPWLKVGLDELLNANQVCGRGSHRCRLQKYVGLSWEGVLTGLCLRQ
jgi:hypothetical protein